MANAANVWVLGPLSIERRWEAERIAHLVAKEIGNSGALIQAEVIAHLVARLMYDHGLSMNDTNAENAQRLMVHILQRVTAIGADLTLQAHNVLAATKPK